MKLKQVRFCYIALYLLALALGVCYLFFRSGLGYWSYLIFAVLIGILALSAYLDYKFWRCPHCGAHYGKRMFRTPKECPECHMPYDGEKIGK